MVLAASLVLCSRLLRRFHLIFACSATPAGLFLAAFTLFGGWAHASAESTPTSTTLALTSGGGASSSVASGSVVTLVASVKTGSTAVTAGQVNFCDASAVYCTDIHVVGTARLTSAGTAALKFRPGIGSHSYKAVFAGTKTYAGSSSGASALTVTGTYPSITALAQSGSPGDYTLTATVGSQAHKAGLPPPTGLVSFLDSTAGNTSTPVIYSSQLRRPM